MAIRLIDRYPNRANPANTDYPHGSGRNKSSPTAIDGTPFDENRFNDQEGFFQSLLEAAEVTPNNTPDTVPASQYADALSVVANGLIVIDVGGSADATLDYNQGRVHGFRLTGALAGDISVIVPDTERMYTVVNDTTGDFDVTVKTALGTGIVVPQGQTFVVRCDGANVVRGVDSQRTIYVGSVAESLNGLNSADGQAYQINGWYEGADVGGGAFVFRADEPKSSHNGGTVISPTVPAVSAQAGAALSDRRDAYLNGAGETDSAGTGCFVRVGDGELYPEMFGAIGDGISDDFEALDKWLLRGGGRLSRVTYAVSQTVSVGNRQKIIGSENIVWGDNGLVSTITWIGSSNGVVVRASRADVGTQPTGGVYAAVIENLNIRGADVAGYGLYINRALDGCVFRNITVDGCNTFGVLGAYLYYCLVNDIVTRNCKGIGQSWGNQWLNSFELTVINAVLFKDLRAAFCGQKYDAVTAPTGFDLTDNPQGGSGLWMSLSANSSVHNLTGERSYGAGIVLDTNANPMGQYHSLYIEGNMPSALSDGATTEEFGLLLNNRSGQNTQINIRGIYGTSGFDRDIYYREDGGSSCNFHFDYLYNSTIKSNVSGPINVTIDDASGASVVSGVSLTNTKDVNALRVYPTYPNTSSSGGHSVVSVSAGQGVSGWASGSTIDLAKVRLDTASQNTSGTASFLLTVMFYASDGAGEISETTTATYLVVVSALRRYNTTISTSSTVNLIGQDVLEVTASKLSTLTPTVTFVQAGDNASVTATVKVAPTSAGVQANNYVVASAVMMGSANPGTFVPGIGAEMGLN